MHIRLLYVLHGCTELWTNTSSLEASVFKASTIQLPCSRESPKVAKWTFTLFSIYPGTAYHVNWAQESHSSQVAASLDMLCALSLESREVETYLLH